MRLRLQKLQEVNSEAQELRQQKADSYKEFNKIFHHQDLLFVSKAIWIELISRHHNNTLAGYFGIEKTCELLAQKYYWPTFCHNVKAYVKSCDVCLSSKTGRHKPYSNLQLLFILTHYWKDLMIDFVTDLSISINWKRDSYDPILVIVDWLTQMVHYKLVKITINASRLVEVIINIIVRHHDFPDSIVTNQAFFFTLKFWLLLCYFLALSVGFSPPFICKLTAKPKSKTIPWKRISEFLSILSRTIGPGFYWWPNLLIIMPKMQALAICLLR